MTVVNENIDLPGLALPTDAVIVTLELVDANLRPLAVFHTASGTTIISPYTFRVASDGIWSLDLKPNSQGTPSGTKYKRTVQFGNNAYFDYIDVPAAGGPYRVDQILSTPPAAIADAALTAHINDGTKHGGGKRLGIAHIANQSTTSATFVDVPGASLTFNNPNPANFGIIVDLPCSVTAIGQAIEFQLLAGATVIGSRFSQKAQVANHSMQFTWRDALANTLYTPVADASVTYKLRWRNDGGTSGVAIVTEFGSPINSGIVEALVA